MKWLKKNRWHLVYVIACICTIAAILKTGGLLWLAIAAILAVIGHTIYGDGRNSDPNTSIFDDKTPDK